MADRVDLIHLSGSEIAVSGLSEASLQARGIAFPFGHPHGANTRASKVGGVQVVTDVLKEKDVDVRPVTWKVCAILLILPQPKQ